MYMRTNECVCTMYGVRIIKYIPKCLSRTKVPKQLHNYDTVSLFFFLRHELTAGEIINNGKPNGHLPNKTDVFKFSDIYYYIILQ